MFLKTVINSPSIEEEQRVISVVCFMRSSAALVYNCKQARIVLAGTSFATTGKFVQTRTECKLVYILSSAAEFRNIQL